jgi:hypothetical protein
MKVYIGSRVFEAYLGVSASIASCLQKIVKKDDFLIYFLRHIGYYVILVFLWSIFFHLSGVSPNKLRLRDTIYLAYKQAKEKYK